MLISDHQKSHCKLTSSNLRLFLVYMPIAHFNMRHPFPFPFPMFIDAVVFRVYEQLCPNICVVPLRTVDAMRPGGCHPVES